MAHQTLADNVQTKPFIEELKCILFQRRSGYPGCKLARERWWLVIFSIIGKLIVEANLRGSCPLYLVTIIH